MTVFVLEVAKSSKTRAIERLSLELRTTISFACFCKSAARQGFQQLRQAYLPEVLSYWTAVDLFVLFVLLLFLTSSVQLMQQLHM